MPKPNNKVQLITYPDSMGGNLAALNHVLDTYFPGLFPGGIHLLPPFPSSGDRGFAPLTYFDIDPRLGSWEDIQKLAEKGTVMLDLMVNHLSQQSPYFQDYLKKGTNSTYADYFMNTHKLWPDGIPQQSDIDAMFLRRTQPYSEFTVEETGEVLRVMTTFGKSTPSEQIDLDVHAPQVRQLFKDILAHFAQNKVTMVRLDAVGYVIKKRGTSCFFVEPDIYEFLEWIGAEAEKQGVTLLPEVHAHYTVQYGLANHGFWIYDFILPYVVLDALVHRNSRMLYDYLKDRPQKQVTMLDCHDGVPVKPDLDDLVSAADARALTEYCAQQGAGFSRVFSEKAKGEGGFDVHQIRGTYYSLLGENDDAYMAARAIQLFVPGIPQIYYVGLLAGANDVEAVELRGDGREINRHNFTEAEVAQCVQKPVVQRLLKLIALRNNHQAFDGTFTAVPSGADAICLEWRKDCQFCCLNINLKTLASTVVFTKEDGTQATIAL